MSSGGSERYSLHMQSGQYLTVEISSGNRHALFSLVKPSPGMARYEAVERAGVKRWAAAPQMFLLRLITLGAIKTDDDRLCRLEILKSCHQHQEKLYKRFIEALSYLSFSFGY